MGYSHGFALPLERLYDYYSDIKSFPSRFPRLCTDVEIVSKESRKGAIRVVDARERWTLDYDAIKDLRSKSDKHRQDLEKRGVKLDLLVRYEFHPPVVELRQRGKRPTPAIRFEIVGGNPGNVMPERGMVYFTKRAEERWPPNVIEVHAEYAGELAISHYLYTQYKDALQSGEFDEINYFYECDVLNLEGPGKRLD